MRLIDADALLQRIQHEELQMAIHGREFSTCFNSPGGTPSTEWWYVEDLIENAPTITPERKRGTWVGIDDEPCEVYECDVCGAEYDTVGNTWDLPNYCPECGAHMGGGQNEAD